MADVNGFDPAAYSIDGARIASDLMRVGTYVGTGGTEGIVSPGDLRVHQLDQAGPQVAIDPGAGVILGRSAGQRNQSYVVNGRVESRLDVDPTGPAGGRSDLVIVRVQDPQFSPWVAPAEADAPDYPYVEPFIIQNVPPTTQSFFQLGEGYSALTLARIDIPANTAAITDSMIKPLRQLAQPRSHNERFVGPPTQGLKLTTTVGEVWPDYRPTVRVPEWAVEAYLTATLSSIGQNGGSAQGSMTAVLGGVGGITGHRAENIGFDLDAPTTGGSRHTLVIGGHFSDIRDVAGTDVTLQIEGVRSNVAVDAGYLETVGGTQILYDILFSERVV